MFCLRLCWVLYLSLVNLGCDDILFGGYMMIDIYGFWVSVIVFLIVFVVVGVFIIVFKIVYQVVMFYYEWMLICDGNIVVVIMLGVVLFGYVLLLVLVLMCIVLLIEFVVWVLLVGVIQIVVFLIVWYFVMCDFNECIVWGEIVVVMYMVSILLCVGIFNVVCMMN